MKREQSISEILASPSYEEAKERLAKEIQNPRFVAVKNRVKDPFKQSPEDKLAIKDLKKEVGKSKNHTFKTLIHATF